LSTKHANERGRVLGGVGGVLALLGVVLLLVTFNGGPTPVLGDGEGSPAACDDEPGSVDGSVGMGGAGDSVTHDVGDGNIATGVCIKAGQLHTGPLENGFYDGEGNSVAEANACYEVEGVGTQEVTVTRVGAEGPACQDISHIDVLFEEEETPTSTPTSTATPTTTAVTPTATPTAMAADTPAATPTAVVAITPPTTGSGGLGSGTSSTSLLGLASLISGLGLVGWARRLTTRR
jgi:hypothetical protein